ncbi:MraW methylase family-domain-containing protein [Pilobolus umbonatus]|nr:MraW methylase family-domain-containing protein [Pilobolus umbonatus]
MMNFLSRVWIKRCYTTLPYPKIHTPVMLPEILNHLKPKSGELYCDMTFGDGGYTKAILDSCDCKVIAVDQDPSAYEKALQLSQLTPYKDRLFPILGKFGSIQSSIQHSLQTDLPCLDGIVMDIGVSSGQLETAERGFSYKLDGPLDMRMFSRGTAQVNVHEKEKEWMKKSISAYEIVNFYSGEQIADIIYQYGGDRLSRKIASAIVTARHEAPIESTLQLAQIIQKACPQPRWQRGNDDMVRNSAARTFQALRIYINNELGELEKALASSEYLLKPNGRLLVVTFHSLEDRIVKNYMYHCSGKRSTEQAQVNQFDLKRAAHREYKKSLVKHKEQTDKYTVVPTFDICTKHVVQPSPEEVELNARSRSAKLRVAQRTSAMTPLNPFKEM